MAEDPNNPLAQTYHVQSNRANAASFILYSTPFFPEIKEEGDTIKVIFNQGYIFDHANMKTDDFDGKTSDNASIPRIKVEDLEHTHAEGEEIEYSLEIQRNRKSGEVIKAKIIRSYDKIDSLTFRNFIVENEVDSLAPETLPDSAGGNGNDSYVYMDLADFKGFELKELYVRENIHVYYRGFEQLGKQNNVNHDLINASDEVYSIINATGLNTDDFTQNTSTGANGMIGIKSIARRKDKGGSTLEDQNIIEIEKDEDYIVLFAPRFDDESINERLTALEATTGAGGG